MGILSRTGTDRDRGIPPRLKHVLLGVLIGFAWGTVMWAITGADGGGRVWLYIAITTGMIGGGVAGIFGAMNARRQGERVTPKIGSRKAKAETAKKK